MIVATNTPAPTVTMTLTPSASPASPAAPPSGTSAVQVWTLIVASTAVVATALSIYFVRKTGRETTKAATKSAKAASRSSKAARRAATASERNTHELETRSRREETLRNLRWAAELAVSDDDRTAQLGVAELNALAESDLLDESQQLFIDAALDSVIEEPEDEIDESEEDVDVEVVRTADTPAEPDDPRLPSDEEPEGGERG
jgi:hypothetical protein